MTRPRRDERGSSAIELLILTPVLVGAILLIVAGSRYVEARGQTTGAAYAAARAASLTSNQEAAVAAGRQAATRAFETNGRSCAQLTVTIDAHAFRPGGNLRASVTCTADFSDLSGLGLPGQETFTSTAVVPLDAHREFSGER